MNYLQLLEHSEKERNDALLSLDLNRIKVYCIKFGLFIPDNDNVFWESVHKAVLQIRDADVEQREKSRRCLRENGASLECSFMPWTKAVSSEGRLDLSVIEQRDPLN